MYAANIYSLYPKARSSSLVFFIVLKYWVKALYSLDIVERIETFKP
jgi:SUMO ligase MMS21 Smc5/6 complex component